MGVKEQSEGLERAIDHMCRKTRDLRRQLRKAVVDHVSDSFLETSVPLLVLIEAARNGRDKEVEEYALVFTEHANKLVEVKKILITKKANNCKYVISVKFIFFKEKNENLYLFLLIEEKKCFRLQIWFVACQEMKME